MSFQSINPATGELLAEFGTWDASALEDALARADDAARQWRATPLAERTRIIANAGRLLREQVEPLARLASLEMGKPITEARAEVEKSAWACDYFAEHAEAMLRPEPVQTDASHSYISYQPLGTVLAIMPWNFPYWQVLRHMAPTLAAGNTLLLKHAPNVPQVAQAIERLALEAGVPEGVFINLPIDVDLIEAVIADPRVHAVTLTGSERAGRSVAELAGRHLKKVVLELGGSDAFVVLEDADLDLAVSQAVPARFQNGGQSCIAAKRIILTEPVAENFTGRFVEAVRALRVGDPLDEATQIGPVARADLRDELHRQVRASIDAGAQLAAGGAPIEGPGYFYQPTVLDRVGPGMTAYSEELFGPVATLIHARDEAQALAIANDSRFGLGGCVWTRDTERGERFAAALESGGAFVNGMFKSDPRLPFGGIKASGYGRELSIHGIREFVNTKTLWVR
ncbi:MAG: NAD-dependent succinate-semialdehyde dehydrogenase [Gammaproteobacteria bacterium]